MSRNRKNRSSVSVEEAWFIRVGLCALKIVPLCLFSWTATTPPQTQQGVVISATSGLLFHISQLWGNQIRPDELSGRWTRATHRLRHTDTHTLTQWCQAQQQWHTNKLPQQPCRTTYTQMSRWQKCHTGFFFKRVNGSTRRVCQSEDVTCAPRHVPDSFLSSTHIVLSSERRHCWRFQTTF